MTNKEFWRELNKLTASLSTSRRIPSLINQARDEHLSIPIVFQITGKNLKAEPAVLRAQGMRFVHGATSAASPSVLSAFQLKPGQHIAETSLDGLFEDLQDCGYDGIAFISGVGLVGFEWKDF